MKFDEFECGYATGFDEGRETGYMEGYNDAASEFDKRIQELRAQVVTLEAQVTYGLGH
jgi:flagellar biosynthesis/type III secretory pathway protein FliH